MLCRRGFFWRYVLAMIIKQSLLLSVLLLIIGILSGCGGIQKVRYYKPSLQDASFESKEWASGLAVVKDDLCFFVTEGASKVFRVYSAGPIGLPIFPIEAIGADRDRPDYVDITVWFVPHAGYHFSFNPNQLELLFSNGVSSFPQLAQVSRFKTTWRKETVYMFKPDSVEIISYPEHWNPKPINDFKDPIQLWNWSRFNFRFEKPSIDAIPSGIRVGGITRQGKVFDIPVFTLKDTEKTKYVISGQSMDGVSITKTPATPCREIFSYTKGTQKKGT